MQTKLAFFLAVALALSACSINDDLRQFRDTVPERISGQNWLALVPLGAFGPLSTISPPPDARSMAARASALRFKAAQLRAHPVLDPARARAMRAALRRFAT
ncbi:MAG TPA: hypothetical protein EYG79_06300 [Rhodobacteraceae bacterium]|nr:hypothetical protein [Paracoccaceae bacterium]